MKIEEYFSCLNKEDIVNQLESFQWSAAKFLAKLLKEKRLQKELGGWAKLFLLLDGEKLVSFVTLSAQDCIADPALSPWLGFFHTAPEYLGHRYGKLLTDHACQVAKEKDFSAVYLATDHTDLYEKYGFGYLENRIDVWGDDSRIYIKKL